MPSFGHHHYMPFLKGKRGEVDALSHLAVAEKERLTPLIDVAGRDVDYKTDQPTETASEALSGLAQQIVDAWGADEECFLDLAAFDLSDRLDNGDHPVTGLFDDARGIGLLAMPVTGLDRDQPYQEAVRDVAAADGRGAAIRLLRDDLADLQALAGELDQLASDLALQPTELDLLLDMGEVTATLVADRSKEAEDALRGLPWLPECRTLTLCFGAFPVSPASTIDPGQAGTLQRRDWKIWTDLIRAQDPLPRLPAFGDYGIAHPEWVAFDPRRMTVTANIRYTADDEWVVVRGRAMSRGGAQFHGLAAQLTRRSEFHGAGHCWGDQYVVDCAARKVGPGNLTTWRSVGTHHHLRVVDQQIANLL